MVVSHVMILSMQARTVMRFMMSLQEGHKQMKGMDVHLDDGTGGGET